jgi:hypothetical protein
MIIVNEGIAKNQCIKGFMEVQHTFEMILQYPFAWINFTNPL